MVPGNKKPLELEILYVINLKQLSHVYEKIKIQNQNFLCTVKYLFCIYSYLFYITHGKEFLSERLSKNRLSECKESNMCK